MAQQDRSNSSLLSEIKKLSVSEKILIIGDIWDSIALSGEELSVTPEQQEELDKRYHDYQLNPGNGSSWDDVKKRFNSNL